MDRTLGPAFVLCLSCPALAADSAYTLGAAVEYPVESRIAAVRVVDMNGDGALDVVVATATWGQTNQLLIYPQLADGTLGEPEEFDFGGLGSVYALAAGDLDGDGDPDIAVSAWDAGTLLFYGTSFGGLDGPYAIDARESNDLLPADVDSDGDTDLLSIIYDASLNPTVYSFDNDGTGTLVAHAVTVLDKAQALGFADVTGDGAPDIVSASREWDWMVGVSPGRGDGTFEDGVAWSDSRGSLAGALATGDFYGTGEAGVAVVGGGNSPVDVYVFPSGGGSADAHLSYDLPASIAAADLDGDGLTDLVVGHNSWGAVSVHLQDEYGLTAKSLYPTPVSGEINRDSLALGDVTGDGCVDVVLGDEVFGVLVLPGQHCGESLPTDTDGDGVPDDNDVCPNVADPGQEDTDGDGVGDACDPSGADTADTADSASAEDTAQDSGDGPANHESVGCGGGCASLAPFEPHVEWLALLTVLAARRRSR